MDLETFLAQVERDIRDQNETLAKNGRLLESCDPDLRIVADLDAVPEPLRAISSVPMGAVRG